MIPFISIVIIIVCIVLHFVYLNEMQSRTFYFMLKFCCIVSVIAIVATIVYNSKQCYVENEECSVEVVDSSELLNLNIKNKTYGHVFLGIGEINEQSYYYYYVKTPNGYTLKQVNAEERDVFINFSNEDCIPHIVCYEKNISFNRKCLFDCEAFYDWFVNKNEPYRYYKIYIPKDSIVANYDVDIK